MSQEDDVVDENLYIDDMMIEPELAKRLKADPVLMKAFCDYWFPMRRAICPPLGAKELLNFDVIGGIR